MNGPIKRPTAEWSMRFGNKMWFPPSSAPNIPADATVLELAMGHGRWTPFLAQRSRRYIGVDFGPSCVKFCLARFGNLTNAEFYHNDGRTMPMVAGSSVHFSGHLTRLFISNRMSQSDNMEEFARVLSPGGRCVIHHPGNAQLLATPAGGRSP